MKENKICVYLKLLSKNDFKKIIEISSLCYEISVFLKEKGYNFRIFENGREFENGL